MRTSLLLCAALLLHVAVEGQDYEIKLYQPVQPGFRYKLSVVAEESMSKTLTEGDQLIRTNGESQHVEFESTVVVLDVFPNGKPSREKHVVQALVISESGTKEQLLTNGTTVISSRHAGKPKFEIEGQPVVARVHKALVLAAPPADDSHTDDELFGTKERKKPGESWTVNTELLAEIAKFENVRLKNISGSVTFKEVIKSEDTDSLLITATVTAKPFPSLPDGFWFKEGSTIITMSGKFPVRFPKGRPSETVTADVNVIASAKPRPPNYYEIQMRFSGSMSKTTELVVIE